MGFVTPNSNRKLFSNFATLSMSTPATSPSFKKVIPEETNSTRCSSHDYFFLHVR